MCLILFIIAVSLVRFAYYGLAFNTVFSKLPPASFALLAPFPAQ